MRENGWVPVRAQEQSIRTEARRGFQKHIVRFARLQPLQTWEKNQVPPEIVLVNSHDKSSAYQLHCGLFRLVCSNGMVVSDGTFQRIQPPRSRLMEQSYSYARRDWIGWNNYIDPLSFPRSFYGCAIRCQLTSISRGIMHLAPSGRYSILVCAGTQS
jgi:hypothetical protein